MNIAELITELQKHPPDLPVYSIEEHGGAGEIEEAFLHQDGKVLYLTEKNHPYKKGFVSGYYDHAGDPCEEDQ